MAFEHHHLPRLGRAILPERRRATPPAAKHRRAAARYRHTSSAADGANAANDGTCSTGTT